MLHLKSLGKYEQVKPTVIKLKGTINTKEQIKYSKFMDNQ